MTSDLTVRILSDIRDAVRQTNTRLDETNTRLDETKLEFSARIDATNASVGELSRRVVESEVRTATAITELHGTLRDVATMLREQHDLRPRLERREQQIAALERRVRA
jgi:predicted  nucleic acid-binding Zn-ribbon protein